MKKCPNFTNEGFIIDKNCSKIIFVRTDFNQTKSKSWISFLILAFFINQKNCERILKILSQEFKNY